jgi:hypothetical protein
VFVKQSGNCAQFVFSKASRSRKGDWSKPELGFSPSLPHMHVRRLIQISFVETETVAIYSQDDWHSIASDA